MVIWNLGAFFSSLQGFRPSECIYTCLRDMSFLFAAQVHIFGIAAIWKVSKLKTVQNLHHLKRKPQNTTMVGKCILNLLHNATLLKRLLYQSVFFVTSIRFKSTAKLVISYVWPHCHFHQTKGKKHEIIKSN